MFSLSLAAQTPKPAATPPTENDGDVVKISTTLIQLDVIVTDKKGNQVTDLKPEDFEIFENGKKQDITNLSYISSNSARQPIDANQPNSKKNDKLSAPLPPVKLKTEQIRRTYAMVVDDLGLSFENVSTVKYALKKFVNEQMQAGDLVAIIRTGSGVGALQSFTSDKRQLFAAIEKVRWNPRGRGGANAFAAIAPPLAGRLDQSSADFRNENFTIGTLGALRYVIRGMKELPGRKSVLLFSEGFQMYSEENGMKTPTRILNGLRVLTDLANRSSVVFYTLDPRGLVNPYGLQAEDNTFTMTEAGIETQQRSREGKLYETQDSLRFLAEETGGTAYVNQNRLDIGLRLAVEDQSGYYRPEKKSIQ
jgi:VWFA-related protein